MKFRNLLLVFLLSFTALNPSSYAAVEHHEEHSEVSDNPSTETPVPEKIVDETIEGPTIGEHGEETIIIDCHEAHHTDLEDEHAHHHANYSPLVFIILALIIGAGTRFFLSRVGIPYTVALLIIGLLLGIVGRSSVLESFEIFGGTYHLEVIDMAIDWAANLDAHMILYVFLPILIFEAAFAMDVHTFKKSFTNSVLLAVPGVLIAIFLTALGVAWMAGADIGISSWDWQYALLFGAVISATDPVAVVALLKELGASKKLATLIEGESLLNDGTAIVIFMVIFLGIGAAPGAETSAIGPIIEFFRVAFGGILVGFILGWIGLRWIKSVFNDMLVEITIIVALAYLTFFLCEYTFGVSGVLGLVTLGLYMAGPGRTKISPEVQHFIHEFWEFTGFTANTLIFLIVGVVIAERAVFDVQEIIVLLLIYVLIHIVRMIVIAILYPVMKRSGYGLAKNHPQILWWGALRGAIGLALALIVESNEAIPQEIREQFLFFTAGIVILTLCVNATSMKYVAKKLGLTTLSKSKEYVVETAVEAVREGTVSTIGGMARDRFFKKVNWEAVDHYLPKESRLNELEKVSDYKLESRRRILEREKGSYWAQFKDGLISSDAYHLLVSEINEIIDSAGERALNDRADLDELLSTKNNYQKLGALSKLFASRNINKLGASFDSAKGFFSAQNACMELIKELKETASEEEMDFLNEMESEIEENKIQALTFLRNFKNQFPNIYRHVSTRQAIRTLLNTEKKQIKDLVSKGRITDDEADLMIEDVEKRMKKLSKEKLKKEEREKEKPKERI